MRLLLRGGRGRAGPRRRAYGWHGDSVTTNGRLRAAVGGFRDTLRILPARERRGDAAQRQHAEPAPTAPDGGVPLAEALLTLIEMLSNAIEGEAAYPRRPELRERFKAIEDAARLLRHEWLDQRIRALLLDGDVRIENENEMFHGLRDIAARAARERERNSPKQGRG